MPSAINQLVKILLSWRGWLCGLLLVTGSAFLVQGFVRRRARRYCFNAAAELPNADTAIVLGAKVHPNNTPSAILEDRLQTALELYRTGKIQRILVSGDSVSKAGDETTCMRLWLVVQGVDPQNITVDPLGRRTLNTMERARRVFQVRKAVICTQAFHLSRSVFLARRMGIDAVGMEADRRRYCHHRRNGLREFLAIQLAFLEITFRSRKTNEDVEV